VVDPVPTHGIEARRSEPRRLCRPSHHRQHVSERDVRSVQRQGISTLLGELQGLPHPREALVGAAEIGEIAAEHLERPELCRTRADRARELECLLADRERLLMAPGQLQACRERRKRPRALRGRRMRRYQLDGALQGGEEGVAATALEQVAAKTLVQERGAQPVAVADQLDRSLHQLDRTRSGAGLAGQLGCPGAELGEVDLHELGRVRHAVPQPEGALKVRVRLRQAEDGLCLACRFDRRDQRLCAATRRRPVGRELRRCRGRAARELLGEPRVQLLALAGQQRRVDRLRQQRMAEAEAAARLVGHEDAVLDRPAQRLAHDTLRQRRHGAEQRVPDVASCGCGQAQQAPRRGVEPGHTLQQQVAQTARQLAAPVPGGEELLGEEGIAVGAGDDRLRQRRRQGSIGAGREQRRQLLVLERTELQHQRGAGAPDAVGEPAHALCRGELVRAVGRQQQDRPVVEVVGEEDDEVERGGVGPVQVLEHQQQRCGGRAAGQQRQHLLEHAQLRARRLPVDLTLCRSGPHPLLSPTP
jgi:hypothetical protein